MPTTTPINALSSPLLADAANIETAVGTALTQIDGRMVPRFANVSARDAAITSPVEGQVSWRSDQDALEFYNGTNWILFNPSPAGVSQYATTSGSNTTTSGTFVNMAGTGSVTSFSFTKKSTGTRVKFDMSVGVWTATAVSGIEFAVNFNGADVICGALNIDVINAHFSSTGGAFNSGAAAGVYTIQGRWRRVSGTGTPTRDINDWLQIVATEVV